MFFVRLLQDLKFYIPHELAKVVPEIRSPTEKAQEFWKKNLFGDYPSSSSHFSQRRTIFTIRTVVLLKIVINYLHHFFFVGKSPSTELFPHVWEQLSERATSRK